MIDLAFNLYTKVVRFSYYRGVFGPLCLQPMMF